MKFYILTDIDTIRAFIMLKCSGRVLCMLRRCHNDGDYIPEH